MYRICQFVPTAYLAIETSTSKCLLIDFRFQWKKYKQARLSNHNYERAISCLCIILRTFMSSLSLLSFKTMCHFTSVKCSFREVSATSWFNNVGLTCQQQMKRNSPFAVVSRDIKYRTDSPLSVKCLCCRCCCCCFAWLFNRCQTVFQQ